MKPTPSGFKPRDRTASVQKRDSPSGENAVALTPPDSGIDFVDRGLPSQLKEGIESLSGMDLSDVRVHANSDQPAQLSALAYTQGSDIHVAPGQERHLPHEAWHVVQQRQGRVKPTLHAKGVAINDDADLEREADLMGTRAGLGASAHAPARQRSGTAAGAGGVRQRVVADKAGGRFMVDDFATPGTGQLTRSEFLAALKAGVRGMAEKILAQIGQGADNCPYIPYWFDYYSARDIAHIEQAIARYAPEAMEAAGWQGCIDKVVEQVRQGFEKHVASGSLEGVPEELPKLETGVPLKSPGPASGVAQLCNSSAAVREDKQRELSLYEQLQHQVQAALAPWGGAQSVGYKGVYGARLQEMINTGIYPAATQVDSLGPGVYVATLRFMAQFYALQAGGVIVEVGYVGDPSVWTELQAQVGESTLQLQGRWGNEDALVHGDGGNQQKCFKLGAASNIALANFRYRVV